MLVSPNIISKQNLHLFVLHPLLALLQMTKALVFLCQSHLGGDLLCGSGEGGALLNEGA